MIKDTELTDEYLKAVTGKFDLEIIFNLELENKNIISIGSIPKCVSMVYLSLSNNKIRNINGIEKLKSLMFLDLSLNEISNIDSIGGLRELRNLKVYGNKISSIPSSLSKLKKLEKFTLQIIPNENNPKMNVSNPICSNSDYRNEVFSVITTLKWLDNVPQGLEPFVIEDNDYDAKLLEKLNPDNFDFNFEGKINMDINQVFSDDDLSGIKQDIQGKYDEFKSKLDEVREEINKIK